MLQAWPVSGLGDTVDPDKKAAGLVVADAERSSRRMSCLHIPSMLGFGMFFITAMVVLPIVAILLMRNVKGNFVGDESGLEKTHRGYGQVRQKRCGLGKAVARKTIRMRHRSFSLKTVRRLWGAWSNLKEELMHIMPRNPGTIGISSARGNSPTAYY